MRTKTFDKQSSKIEYFGPWNGLDGGNELQLESAFNQSYGAGQIGKDGTILMNTSGTSAVSLREGVDFQYGKRLDASVTEDTVDGFGTVSGGIIDTGVSGSLSKPLRILHGTKNIKDATGLNLKVYAKNLSIESSPPSDRIYVDPLKGKVIFPRPIYWSRCESWENIGSPDIGGPTFWYFGSSSTFTTTSLRTGKLGNYACRIYKNVLNKRTTMYISPLYYMVDTPYGYCLSKGTKSFWVYCSGGGSYNDFYYIFKSSSESIRFGWIYGTGYILNYVKNGTFTTYTSGLVAGWNHIYCVWDRDGTLSDGTSKLKFYVNGVCRITLTSDISHLGYDEGLRVYFSMGDAGSETRYTQVSIDNIKIWDYPIEDVSIEYNAGAGRESALSLIYADTDYAPEDIQVGYFWKSQGDTPASLPKPDGADEVIQLENISDYANGIGYFGIGHRIYDTDYSVLAEGTDFYYDEAWDGSGAHTLDKYDDGVSGPLDSGKVIRVVHSLEGVATNLSAMGLKPVCKDMSTDNFSPAEGEFYIDPKRGKIVLPRPQFWWRAKSKTGIIEVSENFNLNGNFSNAHGLDGNPYYGVGTLCGSTTPHSCSIGRNGPFPPKGVLSVWQCTSVSVETQNVYGNNNFLGYGGTSIADVHPFGVTEYTHASPNSFLNLSFGSNVIGQISFAHAPYTSIQLVHLYIVWDIGKGLSGGKSVRVFRNGVEVLSTTNSLPSLSGYTWYLYHGRSLGNGGRTGYGYIQNIRAFDHIPSETPDWLFNNGIEGDALHYIYGSANGYKPNLISPGGVGYYKASGAGSLVRGTI